jgi:cyclitol reductase
MWPGSLPSSYKVVKLAQGGPILEEQAVPIFDEKNCSMVIRPALVGICRSDLREVTRERVTRHDFGHEIVGKFIGANFPVPYNASSMVCLDPHVTISRTSGFGEYVFSSGSSEHLISAFPECPGSLEDYRAVFMEPLACAYHAINRLKTALDVKDFTRLNIGIVGAGNAGTLIGLIAKHFGANVSLMNRGADRLLYLLTNHIFEKEELFTEPGKVTKLDGVVLATTWLDEAIFSWGLNPLRDEGVLLLFGGTSPNRTIIRQSLDLDDIRRNQKELFYKHKSQSVRICGTYGVEPQDVRESFNLLHLRKAFPVERLIVDIVTLDDLCGLLRTLVTGKKPFWGKYLVRM